MARKGERRQRRLSHPSPARHRASRLRRRPRLRLRRRPFRRHRHQHPIHSQPIRETRSRNAPAAEAGRQAAGGRDATIETNPDQLYKMVNAHGRVSVAEASEAFRVSQERIEDWARILEDHRLIHIHYPTFGKPVLEKRPTERAPQPRMKPRGLGKKAALKALALVGAFALLLRQYALPAPTQTAAPSLVITVGGSEVNLLPILLILLVALAVAAAMKRRARGKSRVRP